MAKLVIKDLSASVRLDREAMAAIVGGARVGTGFFESADQVKPIVSRTAFRVIDFPPGFPSTQQTVDERIPPQSLLRK